MRDPHQQASPALERVFGARLVDELLAALARETVTVPAEATIGRVIAELPGGLAVGARTGSILSGP